MSNFVTLENSQNQIKIKNLYNVWVFIGFTWILFHFTIVFFFWLLLESILLVWLFLWIWNLVALILDIPIWALQKYIKPKTFLSIWFIMMIIVSGIFIKFVYFYGISDLLPWWNSWLEKTVSFLWEFLNSTFNILLLILSAVLYWVIKESFDVTIISYIFNNSTPSEYASILSKYNIYNWWWAMLWLIFSWIFLAINIKIAVIIFIFILIWILLIVFKYFDNEVETINLDKIRKIKLDVLKNDLLSKKEEIIWQINTKKLIELSRSSRVILLKPIEIKNKIDFKDIYESSLKGFDNLYIILTRNPRNIFILWFIALIMLYWFWDSFVATYLIDFFKKVIWINSDEYVIKQTRWLITWYVLLWVLVIPAFLFQWFFINKSKKYWVFKVIMFWNILSAISLIFFWFVDNIILVMTFWILNSLWYAATMPLAQAFFSWLYNQEYAKKFNLKEIDTTIAAAPLKILINAANVIWIIMWALIVKIFWFNFFFIIFWLLILSFFIFSYIKMRKELIIFSKTQTSNQVDDLDFI